MNIDLYCCLDDGISNLGIQPIMFLIDLSTSPLKEAKGMDDRKLGEGKTQDVNQYQTMTSNEGLLHSGFPGRKVHDPHSTNHD